MKSVRKLKPVIFLFILFATSSAIAQDVNSQLKNYKILPYSGIGRIAIKIPGPNISDTVHFINGVAEYNQQKYDQELGWLYLTDIDQNMVHRVVLEKGRIQITVTTDSLIFFTGTPNNDALFTLDQKIEPLRMEMKRKGRDVIRLRETGQSAKADVLQDERLKLSALWWSAQMKFVQNNNNMAGLAYVSKVLPRFKTEELKILLDNYKEFSENIFYKSILNRYKSETRTAIGSVTPDFNLESDQGKMVKLSTIKKRLTILDFWASWCMPCRAENPNLLQLYNRWQDKGLEIVGVSIDKVVDKSKWLEAIKADGLTWTQVWDEIGSVSREYGITAIPRTFLIDENGKIVAKDLRGEALNKFTEEFLGGAMK